MKTESLMRCGHSSNAVTDQGKPCCAICAGINDGYDVSATTPDLAGRTSRCLSCKRHLPSSLELPFFEYRPTQNWDSHYCGCRGWN